MKAVQVLRAGEKIALNNNQFVSSVAGRGSKRKKGKGSIGAVGFIIAVFVFFLSFFNIGNLLPSMISDRLVEETDVQYADAVESKKIIFQQILMAGSVPEDTAKLLKQNGVLVGYLDDNKFIEGNNHTGELALKVGDKIVLAQNFISEVGTDTHLYDAFNRATYSRAAYYYDESAQKYFRSIGARRNNYTSDSDFNEVMEKAIGNGSNIKVNTVSLVEKTKINEETGKEEAYYEYETNGVNTNPSGDAVAFVDDVRRKNPASSATESALSSADTLKVADTIAKEKRSELFFVTFMENVSKMKAGYGNEARVNEAMNYLYESSETEVVDVRTGEVIRVTGAPLESPSLYAVLSGSQVDINAVENYSSDRVLRIVENQVGIQNASDTIDGTVASSSNKKQGSIGRYIDSSRETAAYSTIEAVTPIISKSLIDNSYATIRGIDAGELLVEGAVNVGKGLAKASGATAGDAKAIAQYSILNTNVLAMDAKIDRMNRSPFDITSKNTFLGSIVYNFSIYSARSSSLLSGIKSFSSVIKSAAVSFLPKTYASEAKGYLSSFGECETIATIGAVGSAHCSEIATFDTSTLDNPFSDPGFIRFVERNTILDSSGNRKVKPGSDLSKFIIYNNERSTPIGVVDGGILESLANNSSSVGFTTNILGFVKRFLGSSENEKRIASGEIFVYSDKNADWQTYKYAQRYVSLARATAALRQYTNDKTAYNNIQFFEGNINPVIAFIEECIANNK